MTEIEKFVRCLNVMSHSRAGWDYYDMPKEQRARENAEEKAALAEGRRIWDAADAEGREALREAFRKNQPLAQISEFDRGAK